MKLFNYTSPEVIKQATLESCVSDLSVHLDRL